MCSVLYINYISIKPLKEITMFMLDQLNKLCFVLSLSTLYILTIQIYCYFPSVLYVFLNSHVSSSYKFCLENYPRKVQINGHFLCGLPSSSLSSLKGSLFYILLYLYWSCHFIKTLYICLLYQTTSFLWEDTQND